MMSRFNASNVSGVIASWTTSQFSSHDAIDASPHVASACPRNVIDASVSTPPPSRIVSCVSESVSYTHLTLPTILRV